MCGKSKYWPMTPCQSFIAAAMFVTALVLLLFFAVVGKELLCWIEGHPGLAAWFQAIGAIISIIAAFYISRYQLTVRDRRESETAYRKIGLGYSFLRLVFKNYFVGLNFDSNEYSLSFIKANIKILNEVVRILSDVSLESVHKDWAERVVSTIIISQELISICEICANLLEVNDFQHTNQLNQDQISVISDEVGKILNLRDDINKLQSFFASHLTDKHMSYSPSEMWSPSTFPSID